MTLVASQTKATLRANERAPEQGQIQSPTMGRWTAGVGGAVGRAWGPRDKHEAGRFEETQPGAGPAPSPSHSAVLSAGLRAASSSQEERSRGPLKMEGGSGWGTCKRESNDCICHSDDHRQRPSLGGCPTELDGRALRANVVPTAGTWCRGLGGRRRGRAGQCSHHPSGLAASLSLWSPACTPPPLVRP